LRALAAVRHSDRIAVFGKARAARGEAMTDRLAGKRVLVTQAVDYMGPAIADLFEAEDARVTRAPGIIDGPDRAAELIGADVPDIVIANLAHDPASSAVADIDDDVWRALFATMVDPLMWLVRAAAPAMVERGGGKIVAVTSAAPLRGIPGSTAYCAARGAQNAFVRAAGLEFAGGNVQINAIAQNYVSNEAYYPDELVASERFQKHLARNVPVGRVAESWETAELALFLASDRSNFIVGQVIPFAGGWVTTT
jgi:2-keto-3-deoxy-L-fuconate dehydrogenase